MIRTIIACTVSAAIGFAAPVIYGAQTFQQYVDSQLAVLNGSKVQYGVVVLLAEEGDVVYQSNPDLALAPASNQKVLTTVTSLGTLGADYQFTTVLGRINGDLVVVGDGDPGFGDPTICKARPVTQAFDDWAQALKSKGFTDIPGKLIIDDTVFDHQFVHPNWPPNQANRWYTAPSAGLNLNDNCVDLSVEFNQERKPQLFISPATETFLVTPEWIPSKARDTTIWPIWEDPQRLRVKVRLGSRPTGTVNITVSDLTLYFAGICRERLIANGITIKGPIAFQQVRQSDGSLPETLTILAKHQTPIFACIDRANTNSQNFFAECLFKRTGYEWARKHSSYGTGTWSTGQLATRQFLQDTLKLKIDQLFVDDGSGLSKHNRVSANLLAQLLYFAHRQPWGERFRSTLAVAGDSDGTLRRRMRGTPAAGRVFAKTGYIKGVSALSGYVADNQNKTRVIFSMLFNSPSDAKLGTVKSIEDRICVMLTRLVGSVPAKPAGQ